jgi:hypothetical protein
MAGDKQARGLRVCKSPKPLVDYTGITFNRLTGERYMGVRGHARVWLWRCECGGGVIQQPNLVKSGHTRSCGCLTREFTASINLSHGMTRTPTYWGWVHMRQRCENETNGDWYLYGARGIRVCERWASFENFLADMGPKPHGKSIDRWPNQDGDYEPGNCRWATPRQQGGNTRRNVMIDFEGEAMCLAEACRRAKVNYQSIRNRAVASKTPHQIIFDRALK